MNIQVAEFMLNKYLFIWRDREVYAYIEFAYNYCIAIGWHHGLDCMYQYSQMTRICNE